MILKHRIQLIDLLKEMNLPLIVAEIGVAEGRLSLEFMQAGVEILFCVDNWGTINGQKGDGGFDAQWHRRNYLDAMQRLEPFQDKVKILKGMSNEMAKDVPDESLSLVYIDCDHSYEGVMRDLECWYSKVVKGGVIAGHDFLNQSYGVNKAVNEFFTEKEINVIPENHPDDASFWTIKS